MRYASPKKFKVLLYRTVLKWSEKKIKCNRISSKKSDEYGLSEKLNDWIDFSVLSVLTE